MLVAFRFAPLALILWPALSWAQLSPTGGLGLEYPAPAPPSQGHFLTGAYVSAGYTPLPTAGAGYSVQPYLRYVLGEGRRARPFVQYTFVPFWVQRGYGSTAALGPGGVELPTTPGFAPVAPLNPAYNGSSLTMSGLSVGVPVRVGGRSMMLNVAGNVLGGFLRRQ